MLELTAQRTLVKSPPELWTELSDIESLARHLGEFGEIRITRAEPESVVAWEGDNARGTVEIEASGWGTKVVMTALLPEPEGEPEPAAQDPVPGAEDGEPGYEEDGEPGYEEDGEPGYEEEYEGPGVVALAPPVFEPEDGFDVDADGAPEPDDLIENEPGDSFAAAPVPEPRRPGFFARLFGRRRRDPELEVPGAEPGREVSDAYAEAGIAAGYREGAYEPGPAAAGPGPEAAFEAEPEPAAAEPEPIAAEPEPEPIAAEPEPEPIDWGAPDIEWAGEEPEHRAGLAPEQAQAVLDSALDNLGSAHHRPFSRG